MKALDLKINLTPSFLVNDQEEALTVRKLLRATIYEKKGEDKKFVTNDITFVESTDGMIDIKCGSLEGILRTLLSRLADNQKYESYYLDLFKFFFLSYEKWLITQEEILKILDKYWECSEDNFKYREAISKVLTEWRYVSTLTNKKSNLHHTEFFHKVIKTVEKLHVFKNAMDIFEQYTVSDDIPKMKKTDLTVKDLTNEEIINTFTIIDIIDFNNIPISEIFNSKWNLKSWKKDSFSHVLDEEKEVDKPKTSRSLILTNSCDTVSTKEEENPVLTASRSSSSIFEDNKKEIAKKLKMFQLNRKKSESNPNINKIKPENKIPQIWLIAKRWTKFVHWVSTQILSLEKSKQRYKLISRFIEVASQLFKLKNYHSSFAIVTSLLSHPIARLKKSWKRCSEKEIQTYEKLKEELSPSKNYLNYHNLIKQSLKENVPYLPFLGCTTKDLTAAEENSDWIKSENSGMNEINFRKVAIYGSIINSFLVGTKKRIATMPTNERGKQVYDFLKNLSDTMSEELLLRKSQELEKNVK